MPLVPGLLWLYAFVSQLLAAKYMTAAPRIAGRTLRISDDRHTSVILALLWNGSKLLYAAVLLLVPEARAYWKRRQRRLVALTSTIPPTPRFSFQSTISGDAQRGRRRSSAALSGSLDDIQIDTEPEEDEEGAEGNEPGHVVLKVTTQPRRVITVATGTRRALATALTSNSSSFPTASFRRNSTASTSRHSGHHRINLVPERRSRAIRSRNWERNDSHKTVTTMGSYSSGRRSRGLIDLSSLARNRQQQSSMTRKIDPELPRRMPGAPKQSPNLVPTLLLPGCHNASLFSDSKPPVYKSRRSQLVRPLRAMKKKSRNLRAAAAARLPRPAVQHNDLQVPKSPVSATSTQKGSQTARPADALDHVNSLHKEQMAYDTRELLYITNCTPYGDPTPNSSTAARYPEPKEKVRERGWLHNLLFGPCFDCFLDSSDDDVNTFDSPMGIEASAESFDVSDYMVWMDADQRRRSIVPSNWFMTQFLTEDVLRRADTYPSEPKPGELPDWLLWGFSGVLEFTTMFLTFAGLGHCSAARCQSQKHWLVVVVIVFQMVTDRETLMYTVIGFAAILIGVLGSILNGTIASGSSTSDVFAETAAGTLLAFAAGVMGAVQMCYHEIMLSYRPFPASGLFWEALASIYVCLAVTPMLQEFEVLDLESGVKNVHESWRGLILFFTSSLLAISTNRCIRDWASPFARSVIFISQLPLVYVVESEILDWHTSTWFDGVVIASFLIGFAISTDSLPFWLFGTRFANFMYSTAFTSSYSDHENNDSVLLAAESTLRTGSNAKFMGLHTFNNKQ